MNIILFRPAEVQLPLSRADARARHLLGVLRRQPGDTFDAGLVNGPRGKGTVVGVDDEHVRLAFVWGAEPPLPYPLTMVIGLPRPQTARDILRDAATLGVAALHFVRTEKGEASYADASLWKTAEWMDCLVAGAAQAFCTRMPDVTHGRTLPAVLGQLSPGQTRLVLDNYEAGAALATVALSPAQAVVIAVGSERGWAPAEREGFRREGFGLTHLGARVLRTETACTAAIAIVKARCGWL